MSNKSLLTKRNKSRALFFLVTIAAVCLLGPIGSRLIHAQGGGVAPQMEGTWLVTVSPAGGAPPPFPALVTYSAGGGLVVTDSSFPPTQGNVYQGTWVRKGGREFAFTFLGFQYVGGVHSGYVRVLETVTLDPSGDAYRGEGVFQFLDLNRNVVFSEPDTTIATRVKAQ